LANKVRSPNERPLGFDEINKNFEKYFRINHREFWLLSLIIFVKFYLIDRIHPNDEVYWKKIFYDIGKCRKMLFLTEKVDNIMTRIKPLNYLCWSTVIYGQKI